MNEELRKLLDDVWNMKAVCEDLEARKISKPDALTLASVRRDLARSTARLIAMRDKRKTAPAAAPTAAPVDTNAELPGFAQKESDA